MTFRKQKIFILSPARTTGKRAAQLLSPTSMSALSIELRSSVGASLENVFSFCSSLYFRGKATYANYFGNAPRGVSPAHVVTSTNGLIPSNLRITAATLERFSRVPIDPDDDRYLRPLLASAGELASRFSNDVQIILLGSIASSKYTTPLLECFGERLLFPSDFVGRGDMSRGGLLLRAVAANRELAYQQLSTTPRRTGQRPPKLESLEAFIARAKDD